MGVADCIRKKNAVKNRITPNFKKAVVTGEPVLFYQ